MYSAYDLVWGGYFHSGRNCKTREQSEKEVLNMLCNDVEEGFRDLPNKELLDIYEVEIHRHKEKI